MSAPVVTIRAYCPECDGEGHLAAPVSCFHSTIQSALSCSRCGGSDVEDEVCEVCHGLGEVDLELEDEDLDEYVIDALHLNRIESAAVQAA